MLDLILTLIKPFKSSRSCYLNPPEKRKIHWNFINKILNFGFFVVLMDYEAQVRFGTPVQVQDSAIF